VTIHMLSLVPGACAAPGAVLGRPGTPGRAAGRVRYGHTTAITAAARPGYGKSSTASTPRPAPSKR
jgi:hypothetical protein